MVTPISEGVAFVRRHPEMFFGDAPDRSLLCATQIAEEALALGATSVRIEKEDPWWIIASDYDWFRDVPPEDLFKKIIPLPEVGANSCRREVVLGAFAEAIASVDSVGTRSIMSGEAPPEVVWSAMDARRGRALAFRFPSRDCG